jgi:hypothetical protein
MDYYEELGVDRTASTAEVRRAYRRLASLLHPDHCTDPATRRLAELQMARLNAVVAALTNLAERKVYDRSLALSCAPRPAPRTVWLARCAAWLARCRRPRAWIPLSLAVLVVLGTCAVNFRRPAPVSPAPSENAPGASAAPDATAAAPKPSRVRVRRKPEASPAMEAEAATPAGREPAVSASPVSAPPVSPPPITDFDPPPEQRIPPAPAAVPGILAAAVPQPPPATLAGEWFYVPSAGSRDAGLYAPEFIQLRLTECAAGVHGHYSARYRVTNQAIPPGVVFDFEGQPAGDTASLPWIAAGGSRGRVDLKLLRSGELEVGWAAEKLGPGLGLISGRATLVRKLE